MQENFERRAGNFLARRSNWRCYALPEGEGLNLGDDAYLRVAEELDDVAASGVKSNNGIGYGGKDDGSHDPSARRYRGFEDDDEEEDEDY